MQPENILFSKQYISADKLFNYGSFFILYFSEEKAGQMWRDMVASLVKKLQNPYFRSMFEFLLIMVQWNGSDQESFR